MKIKFLFLLFALMAISCVKEKSNENVVVLEDNLSFDVSAYDFTPSREIPEMESTNPDGEKIKVNSHYITKGDKPWIVSYADFHYGRYPAEHWEDAILKMKSQGFYGISSYVLWIFHEEEEGVWNWEGRNNLRHFLELCKKHDMGVFMRIGPWANGECRNGGHPDWLVERLGDQNDIHGHQGGGGRLRTTDPEYVAYVDELYRQLSMQMEGMYYKDGGPIFAIQLDNELTPYHGGNSAAELIELEKEIALKYGMQVPIYTSTGWNGAAFTQDVTIPVHGSYADYFWGEADQHYRTPAFSFSNMRAVDDIDTQSDPMEPDEIYSFEEYNDNPYLTCETGIGMNLSYHRRTNIKPEDNGAVSLVELGSGCNAMGYYMGIGGSNPIGKLSYMNRAIDRFAASNPVISNDYQSAIGEFGQIRKSYYEYPVQLNFMKDFGQYLAPCRTFIPQEIDEMQGNDIYNSYELQRALRSDGNTAFLFVNNHIKHDTAFQFEDVQFDIKLKNEKITIPQSPISIPAGSYFYWPINLKLGDITIKQATAQPMLYLKESNTYVFFKNDGIPAEFVFASQNVANIETSGAEFTKKGAVYNVSVKNAGLNCFIDIDQANGITMRFLVLTENQAKMHIRNGNTLYLTNAEVLLFDGNKTKIISENTKNSIWMYPKNTIENLWADADGVFEKVNVDFKEINVDFATKQVQDGKNIIYKNPTYRHNDNVGVPEDSIFAKGSIVELVFPKGISEELYDVRVTVDYEASALRFYKNGEFVYDNYYNETAWVLGARHLLSDYNKKMKLELKFIPLQPEDKIYINGKYWPNLNKTENVLNINSISAKPVYEREF